jgi:hypothetical protein
MRKNKREQKKNKIGRHNTSHGRSAGIVPSGRRLRCMRPNPSGKVRSIPDRAVKRVRVAFVASLRRDAVVGLRSPSATHDGVRIPCLFLLWRQPAFKLRRPLGLAQRPEWSPRHSGRFFYARPLRGSQCDLAGAPHRQSVRKPYQPPGSSRERCWPRAAEKVPTP